MDISSSHPLTDVEYADDTVLMARTHETVSRLLHLLQHLAARIDFLLNGSKCLVIVIHGSPPVSLSHTDERFPPKPPIARKPYISSDTISLIAQLPHTSSTDLKPLRNKIKKSSKLGKKRWISSNLHVDYIGSPWEHWRTIKRYDPSINLELNQSIFLMALHASDPRKLWY